MLSEAQVARNIGHAEEARPVSRTKYQKEVSLEEIVKDRTASVSYSNHGHASSGANEQHSHVLSVSSWTTSSARSRMPNSCNSSHGSAAMYHGGASCLPRTSCCRRHGSRQIHTNLGISALEVGRLSPSGRKGEHGVTGYIRY